MADTKNDAIYNSLISGGYGPGSIATMERKRLLAATGKTEPAQLTLQDLYKLAGERPRLY